MYGLMSLTTAEAENTARKRPAPKRSAGIFQTFRLSRNHIPRIFAKVRRIMPLIIGASRAKGYSVKRSLRAGILTAPKRTGNAAKPMTVNMIENIPTPQRIHPRSPMRSRTVGNR